MNQKDAIAKYLPMTETSFFILLATQEEIHGYGIMKQTKLATKGEIILGAGTIYNTLAKMETDGLITVTHAMENKKLYLTTYLGTAILMLEKARLVRNLTIVNALKG